MEPTEIIRMIAKEQFTFPGGYEMIAVMKDGGLVCSGCVQDNYKLILQSTKDGYNDDWVVYGVTTSDMLDGSGIQCDNCYKELTEVE